MIGFFVAPLLLILGIIGVFLILLIAREVYTITR